MSASRPIVYIDLNESLLQPPTPSLSLTISVLQSRFYPCSIIPVLDVEFITTCLSTPQVPLEKWMVESPRSNNSVILPVLLDTLGQSGTITPRSGVTTPRSGTITPRSGVTIHKPVIISKPLITSRSLTLSKSTSQKGFNYPYPYTPAISQHIPAISRSTLQKTNITKPWT